MSKKKISKEQPENFDFDKKNLEIAEKILSNYPKSKKESAVMALLYLAQRQNNNWIPLAAMKKIANFLISNSFTNKKTLARELNMIPIIINLLVSIKANAK